MRWKQHELGRPRPAVVMPAPQMLPAPPPADAVVLFDGSDLAAWERVEGGGAAPWKVENGHFEVAPGTGPIRTRASFGDVQLHVEWAAPDPVEGDGQDRGNSGVFFMGGRYEVQVLNSYENDTYPDGQAGAIYGQFPPLANAMRPPGEWQAYDLYFRRPRFDAGGALVEPARLTVVHNGILIQNNEELEGLTAWLKTVPYEAHAAAGPIQLQDHGAPVRFRNVWLREIPERPAPPADYAAVRAVALAPAQLDRLAGTYERGEGAAPITITREGDLLLADFAYRPGTLALVPVSETEFVLAETAARVVFDVDDQGAPTGLTFHLGGAAMRATRVE